MSAAASVHFSEQQWFELVLWGFCLVVLVAYAALLAGNTYRRWRDRRDLTVRHYRGGL